MPGIGDIDVSAVLRMEPARALEYFRGKGFDLPSWRRAEIRGHSHAVAFTVAKATKPALLQDIRREVDAFIAEGRTYREALPGMEEVMRKHGWWGKVERENPLTGEIELVQLGSPRRIRTILRTNARTSFAAARFQAQKDNAERGRRRFWMYDAIEDSRTRPSHLALNNHVYPHDDPFWERFYPPNGWNCRCRVRALDADEVERMGLEVRRSEPSDFTRVDATAGGIEVPTTNYRGIVTADPGWDHAPTGIPSYGDLKDLAGQLGGPDSPAPFLTATDRRTGRRLLPTVLPGQKGPGDFPGLGPFRPRSRPAAPAPASKEAAIAAFHQAIGWRGRRRIGDEEDLIYPVRTPVGEVGIQHKFLDHTVGRHAGRADFLQDALPALQDPDEIWLTWIRTVRGEVKLRAMHFAGSHRPDTAILAVIDLDPAVGWTFFPAPFEQLAERRRGQLLYARRRGGE